MPFAPRGASPNDEGAEDLSHAAGTKGRHDLIRNEMSASRK
jgi:hypothetical protein